MTSNKPRERARDRKRMVDRRQRQLEKKGVLVRMPTGDKELSHVRPLAYLKGQLLTDDPELVEEILDHLRLSCGGCEPIDDRIARFSISDDPAAVARRVRDVAREVGRGDVAVGPHHVLTLSQRPRIGPGSDPYPPAGKALIGPAFDSSGHVAVIDTGMWDGMDPTLPAVVAGAGTDPVDLSPTDATADYDGAAHGGFIASVITNAAGGGAGVKIVAKRAFDREIGVLTEESVVNAVEAALSESDIVVVNLSLGTYEDDEFGGDVVLLRNRMKHWIAKTDALFVCAAGNDERTDPWYPAGFAAEKEFSGRVVSVGALEARGDGPGVHSAAAGFSNHGPWVHAWAPGVGVVSAYPDKLRFDYGDGGGPADVTVDGTTSWDGTSFAAPFVAAEIMRYAAAKTDGNAVAAWKKIRGESPFVVFWPSWGSPPVE